MATRNKTPADAKALLDSTEGWGYLDVRSVEEFEAGHVPGARNIPLMHKGPAGMTPNAKFADVVKAAIPRDTKLVVGCAGGGRSLRACEMLEPLGYANLVNMEGGFLGGRDPSGRPIPGWTTSGFPVEKETPLERTYAHLERSRA